MLVHCQKRPYSLLLCKNEFFLMFCHAFANQRLEDEMALFASLRRSKRRLQAGKDQQHVRNILQRFPEPYNWYQRIVEFQTVWICRKPKHVKPCFLSVFFLTPNHWMILRDFCRMACAMPKVNLQPYPEFSLSLLEERTDTEARLNRWGINLSHRWDPLGTWEKSFETSKMFEQCSKLEMWWVHVRDRKYQIHCGPWTGNLLLDQPFLSRVTGGHSLEAQETETAWDYDASSVVAQVYDADYDATALQPISLQQCRPQRSWFRNW